jgi:hypothetical protein
MRKTPLLHATRCGGGDKVGENWFCLFSVRPHPGPRATPLLKCEGKYEENAAPTALQKSAHIEQQF